MVVLSVWLRQKLKNKNPTFAMLGTQKFQIPHDFFSDIHYSLNKRGKLPLDLQIANGKAAALNHRKIKCYKSDDSTGSALHILQL